MQTFLRAVLGQNAFERISEERMEQARSNVFPAEFLGSGFAPLTADQVRNVQTPTLLVTGERSPSILIHATQRLEELLPHAERVEITEASHGMHEDNPEAFNAAVSAFLEKLIRPKLGNRGSTAIDIPTFPRNRSLEAAVQAD